MRHRLSCIARVLKHHHDRYQKLNPICAIDISHLGCSILDLGYIDRINMLPRQSNGSGLKGAYIKEKFNNGALSEARIYYDMDLSYFTYRYVKAKELSHVFDQPHEETRSRADIRALAVYASSRSGPPTNPAHEAEEKAEQCAIELLFPFEHRRDILQRGVPPKTTLETLTSKLEIPFEHVEKALSTGYHSYIKSLRNEAGIADLF